MLRKIMAAGAAALCLWAGAAGAASAATYNSFFSGVGAAAYRANSDATFSADLPLPAPGLGAALDAEGSYYLVGANIFTNGGLDLPDPDRLVDWSLNIELTGGGIYDDGSGVAPFSFTIAEQPFLLRATLNDITDLLMGISFGSDTDAESAVQTLVESLFLLPQPFNIGIGTLATFEFGGSRGIAYGLYVDPIFLIADFFPDLPDVQTANFQYDFSLGLVATDVPEPGALGQIGIGLLGVALARRRRVA